MSGNYVINIGRQLGSGGKEIGEKLAARLGIDFYDKELINLASEESGLCKEFFEKADEKAKALSADCSVCVFLSSVKGQCHVPTV
jgi:shikimate kinase